MQGSSHENMVLSGARLPILPAFISVSHLVVGMANRVIVSAYTAYFCGWF